MQDLQALGERSQEPELRPFELQEKLETLQET